MRTVVGSIESKYREYKKLAEDAMAQVPEEALGAPGPGGGSSIATIARHVGGNFASRFSDFLTADGEKPWRDRESEFVPRTPSRAELLEHWERGWGILFHELAALTDADLGRTVTIRGKGLSVLEALIRSLTHACYHVGQIVYLAKSDRGDAWRSLSIPPGQSETYLRTLPPGSSGR
ncbi:MAG: DUF1572 family protein [Hyphomicrobiales bacterium]